MSKIIIFFLFLKVKKLLKVKAISITPKIAKCQHNSLSGQNSIKFITYFTQTMKKFIQALLARSYVFPSLVPYLVISMKPLASVPIRLQWHLFQSFPSIYLLSTSDKILIRTVAHPITEQQLFKCFYRIQKQILGLFPT